MRGIPDLALNADPATGYEIFFEGQAMAVGGTSVAAPLFAAIVALANEHRAKYGLAPTSGLTDWLYANADKGFFRDIAAGNNTFNGVTGYVATKGWDACTGFGSLDATKFIESISGHSIENPAPTPNPTTHPKKVPHAKNPLMLKVTPAPALVGDTLTAIAKIDAADGTLAIFTFVAGGITKQSAHVEKGIATATFRVDKPGRVIVTASVEGHLASETVEVKQKEAEYQVVIGPFDTMVHAQDAAKALTKEFKWVPKIEEVKK